MVLRESSSTPDRGSSRIMIFGFTIKARAMRIRCFCPPEHEKKDFVTRWRMPTVSKTWIVFSFSSEGRN